jgi:phospholipase/carboxylesterase
MPEAPLVHQIAEGPDDGPLLVLLHGRGADEGDLLSLGRLLMPGATTVAPRAPFPGAAWGYGGGYAWYRYLHGTTPEPTSFREGQARLAAFLEWLPGHLGRPDAALIVGGFSQGGTSSLAWALRHPGVARAVLVFSGFLADHPDIAATRASVADTPIWWGHGTRDPAIPFGHAEAGWATLRGVDARLGTFTDAGIGHTISPRALEAARQFIASLG